MGYCIRVQTLFCALLWPLKLCMQYHATLDCVSKTPLDGNILKAG